ncbi:MAG TPA: hypothetical protein VGO78_06460, partial [Acidimicrobiales bacterium]|nr:hypothetical protein [Acidimicrobiales bacterium]
MVIVSIFAATTIAVQLAGASTPAQADGLNFVCSAADEPPDGGPGPGEFEQLRAGLAASLLTGQNFFTFKGLAPPGVPVVGGGTTDPVTGGTLFTRTLSPARVGPAQNIDFFGAGVPGSSGPELSFGLDLRNLAGIPFDDMGLKRLLNQNFGLPNDTANDVSVVGIDVDVNANSAMAQLPSGFRGSFEAVFAFKLADGTDQIGGVRIEFDSLKAGAKIPDVSSLALAFKTPGDADHTYFAFGQKAQYASFDGTTNQPAVGFGVDLAVIEPGSVERDVLAVKADWTAAPRQVAVGLAQLCPDRGHIAWNMDPGGLPHPETAALDLKFRSGDRLGQTIRVDDGAGGSKTIRADEIVLDAHIDKLPRLMDFIALRDQMTLTHTSEAAPDLTLNKFDMADDDPNTADDRPIHVTGHVGALPRHVLFRVDRNGTAAINRAELTAWTLNCPGEPAPPGLPAPPDVSRNDLVGTLPLFPVGCTRHNLSQIPTAEVNVQNWLPEDLDAQAATADLRTAPQGAEQYGFFATRATNPLGNRALWAFGAKVNGVQRGTVDLTGAAPGGSKARVYLQRLTNPATNDSARFVVDLDNRTSTDAAANTKTRVAADATITNLPKTLRLDAVSGPGTPLDLTWRADAAFAVTDGSVDAQFAGPSALVAHGAFETGAVGAGSLPPAANVQINGVSAPGGPPGGAVHYGIPAPVTDTFPTPTVPAFPTSTVTRIHAGAELTTLADRQAGLGTRLHADLDVPRSIGVSWTTGPDGRLESVFGNLCNPDTPAACAATRFDATAARGPRTPVDRAALLTPPALPTPTGVVADAVPGFTDFRPGSGARAIILGPDSWGADAVVKGISQFSFQREPLDVAVRLANQEAQPFGINLLDGSQVTDTGSGPQPQVLFADAALDRLPQDIRIRQQDLNAGPDQPWLWVNTEDVNIGDIANVDFHEDPAGTRPRLTGVLRLGDAQTLRDKLPFADRKTPVRDGSRSGVDAWADFDLDHSLLALDTSASVEVPRHVALWKPTLVRCDESVDDVSACQTRPTYEIDKTETVAVKYRTTSHELGDLHVEGNIHGDGLDWTAAASVEHVPGIFDGGLVLSDNTRLSWIDVDVSFHANAPLGAVRASVVDNDAKAEYRQSADDPEHPGQCRQDDDQCTANYAIDLANVPADLDVTARIQGSPEGRLTPSPDGTPPDPSEPQIDFGGLGFVHANVDLLGTATQVAVQGRIPTDGEFAGTISAFDGNDVPTPISGFLNVRVDHVTVGLDSDEGERHPFEEFAIDGGGIVGNLTGIFTDYGPDIGRPFQALTFPLDALIGGLLSLLFGGPVNTRFDMDFDLPLLVAFDRADIVRVGMSGTTLSVDEHHAGEGDPATIATRQQSLPSEAELAVDGAFFHHRDVSFVHDALFEGFDVHNNTEDTLQDVGIFRHEQCRTQDEDHVCYFLARN